MPAHDVIDQDHLRAALVRPGGQWQRIDVVPEAGSTNADLAAAARAGEARAGAVLIADFQSAGRGRQGRTWTGPRGTNVAMSMLLSPSVATHRWTWLPLLGGLAVAAGLRRAAGVPARLKWPNDVLVGEHKVCGILAERVETPTGPACVLGMGINVHLETADLPVPTATSLGILAAAANRPGPGRGEVIIAVLTALDALLGSWTAAADDSALAEAYVEQSDTLGRRVRVMLSDGSTVEGDAESLDGDGRLRVRTLSGLSVFGAGDVIHLRA